MTYDELVPGDILFDMSKEDMPVWLMVRKGDGLATWLDLCSERVVEEDPLGRDDIHPDYTVLRREGR